MKTNRTAIILVSTLFVTLGACAPETASEEKAVEERLEPADIQMAVRADYFPGVKACYEAVLADEPQAGGKVAVDFVIREGFAEDIVVTVVEGDLERAAFKGCMLDGLLEVEFPVVARETTVSYPIALSNE